MPVLHGNILAPPRRRNPVRAASGALVVVAAAALVVGCALAKRFRFEPPDVVLETVEVTQLGLQGGSLRLWLDVYNPNAYDLRGRRIQVRIALEDTPFGAAELEEGVQIPAREHGRVSLPVSFTWDGVGVAARGLLGQGSVQYRLDGAMWVDTPGGERTIRVDRTGTVTMKQLVER